MWPTNLYPTVLYSTSVRVEARHPATVAQPQYTQLGQTNISASGRRETFLLRREETRQVSFPVEGGLQIEEWGSFVRDWGAQGRQFELLLDRHTGALMTFQNTVEDGANKNVVGYAGTNSWTTHGGKTALVVQSGAVFAIANPAGSLSAPLVNSGGVVVMTFVPREGSNTGSVQVLLDCGSAAGGPNRLTLYKSGSCWVSFNAKTSNGSAQEITWKTASWTANADVITLVARFTTQGSLSLWYTRNGVVNQASEYTSALGGGVLGTLPNTIAICQEQDTANYRCGVNLLHFATYCYPYDDPTILSSYFPVGRNYYNKAELADQVFAPARTSPGVDQWVMALNVRQGF